MKKYDYYRRIVQSENERNLLTRANVLIDSHSSLMLGAMQAHNSLIGHRPSIFRIFLLDGKICYDLFHTHIIFLSPPRQAKLSFLDRMTEINRILIYNPNSSQSILEGLKSILEPIKEDGIEIDYQSGPESVAPESINDVITSIQSSKVGFDFLIGKDEGRSICKKYKAILICCFSDHPLVKMLENFFSKSSKTTTTPTIKVMHLLQSGLLASLAFSAPAGKSIGIITTGKEMVKDIDDGVSAFFGSSAKGNDRYAGCIATGLGVLQLRDPSQKEFVEHTIRQNSAELAKRGIGAIMLGCAGMAGMEHIVRKGLADHLGEEANKIAIIDTAKAGLLLLTAQIRMSREFLP